MAQWAEHQTASQKVTVPFPVAAHAQVAGQVPTWGPWGSVRGNRSMFLSHVEVSPPLSPSLFLPLKKKKRKKHN